MKSAAAASGGVELLAGHVLARENSLALDVGQPKRIGNLVSHNAASLQAQGPHPLASPCRRRSFHVMQIRSCPIGFDRDLRARYAEKMKTFNDRKEF
jgi:hypothetical protein